MSSTRSRVAREHELDRALYSLRFSGGVLITGEAEVVGKTFLAARVAARAAAALLRQARERLGRVQDSAAVLAASPLTQRETEVAQLAGRGRSDREIADDLVLSIRTVQSHLASAYRKLGLASRIELKS